MDARASIISNNLNIRIKALTILTIAIMLPTLVVSTFSMNVKIPLKYDEPYSFWIIFFLALTSAIITGLLWWRRKW
jgi:magnesium transporter